MSDMYGVLTRVEFSKDCTRGILVIEGYFVAMTLEYPVVSLLEENTCIPPGNYVVSPVKSPSKGQVYEVSGPRKVRIYKGIALDDRTEGNILLGTKLVVGKPEVTGSSMALDKFLDTVMGRILHLSITESV